MLSSQIILPIALLGGIVAVSGCQQIDPLIDTPLASATNAAQQWQTPPSAASQPAPIYLAPGDPEFTAPGTPIVVHPTIITPPGGGGFGSQPYALPGQTLGAEPSFFDILPNDAGAISPDFGLPRAPVVENRVPNPLVVPVGNNELAWDQLVDVVTAYFPIQREQPVQQLEGMLTEGYIETPFQTGATLFEPQRNDSVGRFNRWQSTLQTIRRKAFLNVQPTAGGYAVRIQVVKQLEDLPQPQQSLAGAAVLRSDNSLPTERRANFNEEVASQGWIDLGRDEPLEQEMLRRIRDRLAAPLNSSAAQTVF